MPRPPGSRNKPKPAPAPEPLSVPPEGALYYNPDRPAREALARIMVADKRDYMTNVIDVLVSEALARREQEGKAC